MPTCGLTPTPGNPNCAFQATAGATITLETKDLFGVVLFNAATYAGNPVTGAPGRQITFKVVAGSNRLDVTYFFSDSANGSGELHEVCDGNPFLKNVHALDPAVSYMICA